MGIVESHWGSIKNLGELEEAAGWHVRGYYMAYGRGTVAFMNFR
jgi:hypothetical protein